MVGGDLDTCLNGIPPSFYISTLKYQCPARNTSFVQDIEILFQALAFIQGNRLWYFL